MTKELSLLIIAVLFLALVVLCVMLIFSRLQRERANKAALKTKEKLRESYQDLKTAYDEVTATKNELNDRYEELKRSKEHIKKVAYTDYLTGLPNRVACMNRLEKVLGNLQNGEMLGVLDMDMDNFKIINESYGHSYGDDLLLEISKRLQELLDLDGDDYLARTGGDEFIVITKNVKSRADYEKKLQRLQRKMREPYLVSTREFIISSSIGAAIAPFDGRSMQNLTKNLDAAMFSAKEQGKDTYVFYTDDINKSMLSRVELQAELRKAIEEEQFEVYYQPQMDLATDRIVGFEALVRWHHPKRGLVMPSEFIQVAEESGLIVAIGTCILWEACKELKSWQDAGCHDKMLAVNLSARQFRDREFFRTIKRIIDETQIDPRQLELEITETMALEDIEYTVSTLKQLKELGITFALDDFGTGYSSLNYLKRLPVNNLKIDKSFLDTVLDNESDQKIVQTIIDLAQTLNLVVIAEGVEKEEQEAFLKHAKCDKAQGYLYSKPLKREDAKQLLQLPTEVARAF